MAIKLKFVPPVAVTALGTLCGFLFDGFQPAITASLLIAISYFLGSLSVHWFHR